MRGGISKNYGEGELSGWDEALRIELEGVGQDWMVALGSTDILPEVLPPISKPYF